MTLMTIAVVVACLFFFYVGVPWVYARWARTVLARKASKRRALVLTFDDGPGSRLTPAILNLSGQSQAKATFFLPGSNIAGREAIGAAEYGLID